MIYTSYFGKLDKLVSQNIFPISIARKSPSYYHGCHYLALAPTWEILEAYKKFPNVERYTEVYTAIVLNNLDVFKVVSELNALAKPMENIALICYEHSRDFCHRKLVRDWLVSHGYSCKEFEEEGL